MVKLLDDLIELIGDDVKWGEVYIVFVVVQVVRCYLGTMNHFKYDKIVNKLIMKERNPR